MWRCMAHFGLDWLGTKPLLDAPTFVAGFGQWRVVLAEWVPVFVALMPILLTFLQNGDIIQMDAVTFDSMSSHCNHLGIGG